jgi:hypothetical protein
MVVVINIFVFGAVYPDLLNRECEACTYQKDFAILLIFIVPIPSATLIYAVLNIMLSDYVEKQNE